MSRAHLHGILCSYGRRAQALVSLVELPSCFEAPLIQSRTLLGQSAATAQLLNRQSTCGLHTTALSQKVRGKSTGSQSMTYMQPSSALVQS